MKKFMQNYGIIYGNFFCFLPIGPWSWASKNTIVFDNYSIMPNDATCKGLFV